MKAIKRLILTIAAMTTLSACEKDGDKIYLSSLEESNLIATKNEVLLSQETSKQIVLSLAWTRDDISTSDPDMQAPNQVSMALQVSTENDFSVNVVESVENSLSKSYTGSELNTTAKKLGTTPDISVPLYFRLKTTTGNNMEPVYSNIVTVAVTPYLIDMTIGYILDSKQADTGLTLYSPEASGEYTGFMGVTAWYNYYLKEGDGTIWGNQGVAGTDFLISSEDSKWNFWFPGMNGCYYVDVNTPKKIWSALYIPSLMVSGDLEAEMAFDRTQMKWKAVFNATNTGTMTLKIAGTGKLYDYSTGTDDSAAKDTPVGFTQNGEAIAFGEQAGNITVNIPQTGECTLVLDLSNPKVWSCQVISGSDEPATVNKEIYLIGIDDGLTNSDWNFDNKLYLHNEDNLSYTGVINVNSKYGYQIATEDGNWNDKYTMAEGDAYAGTLVFQGESNIAAPTAGLYFFHISLKELTYALTGMSDKIYINGLDDKWNFDQELTATATPGIYSGRFTVTGPTSSGFKIHLFQGNWDIYYGGSEGNLIYDGGDITDSNSWTAGTYTITVDLINQTYTIE